MSDLPAVGGLGPRSSQSQLLMLLSASNHASHPYHNRQWRISSKDSTVDADLLKTSIRAYYLSKYLQPSQLSRLITHVPYICTSGDSHIVTQDGSHYSSLADAKKNHPYLISNDERRLSRKKCLASAAKVYSIGGYKTPLKVFAKEDIFECIVVSGAGPQFETDYLDFQDFIIARDVQTTRLDSFAHFGEVPKTWLNADEACGGSNEFIKINESHILHAHSYLQSMKECMSLWLQAFNDMVKCSGKGGKGYFKVTAIGTGFFADVANTHTNIGTILMPLILQAVEEVLKESKYPDVAVLEFPDFSGCELFTPSMTECNGIKLVKAPFRDVLEFSDGVKQQYVVGVLNPGDCFACVGNELGYGSVEAMLGNNTSIRTTQCYIWNELVLDESSYIAIDDNR